MKTNPLNTSASCSPSLKQTAYEKEFFQVETPALLLSSGCQHLQHCMTHTWMFELISIHQSCQLFTCETQRWEFLALHNEIWALCFDSSGNKLMNRTFSIFEYIYQFTDQVFYVSDQVCMLEEEYKSIVNQLMIA